ncbi:hypothetical protein [Acinetobacter guillouiae]|uniref:hypothetical protein n=1 Tax=Acinetobacter guillouiae TaxID=106649 RepID=UPI002FDB0083
MALKNCKECGNQVSDKADKCPSCGVKIKKPLSPLAFLGILFILFAIIGSYLTKSVNINRESQTQSNELVDADVKKRIDESGANSVVIMSKRLIKNSAKDKDSLKFRNIITNKTTEFGLVACGEFNGRNSFGAMTGYKRFISGGQTLFIDGANDTTIPFSEMWIKACAK